MLQIGDGVNYPGSLPGTVNYPSRRVDFRHAFEHERHCHGQHLLGRQQRRDEEAGGVATLSGSNSYTGPTTINAGTLPIGNGTTGEYLASPTIANSGALVFNHTDTLTYSGAISGSGNLTQAGGGVLILAGSNNTYRRDDDDRRRRTANRRTARPTPARCPALSSSAATPKALTFNMPSGGTLTASGNISGTGAGGLTMSGSGGAVTLSGSVSYTGPTTIGSGAVLDFNGGVNENLSGAISGGGELLQAGLEH